MFARLTEKTRPHLLPITCLLLATFLVYGRMLWHDFQASWDDNFYISNNQMVYGLSLDHIRQAFSAPYFGNYAPLHLISYMVDFELWQLRPGGYMFINLLIHAVNGLLFYLIVFRLHGQRFMALTGAAVFLLHPLQVESVAWVSQRKNLLAMLFFLFAWKGYLDFREEVGRRRMFYYISSLFFFLCAVLSKSVAVIFPLVLVLTDCCFPASGTKNTVSPLLKAGRLSFVLDKIPFVIAAVAVAVLTLQSQAPVGDNWGGAGGGGRVEFHGGSPLATFYSMLPVFCRYLALLVWPSNLNARYDPMIHIIPDASVIAAGLVLSFTAWCCYRLFQFDRKIGFWVLVFWVGFLPVSQIVPLVTMMNDRYVYFPMLGFAALTGVLCQKMQSALSCKLVKTYYLIAGTLFVLMSVTAYQRVGVWRDSVSLWSDSVRKNPTLVPSWLNLAQAYDSEDYGLLNKAIEAYNRAVELSPYNTYALFGLGRDYLLLGQYDKALWYTNALLRVSPEHVMGLSQLGAIYQSQGDYDLADRTYQRAAKLQPESLEVAMQLAGLSVLRGDMVTAHARFMQIENGPYKLPDVAYMLAWFEVGEGNMERALDWLETALQRGYAANRSANDMEELQALRGNPRFEQLLQRYGCTPGRGQ